MSLKRLKPANVQHDRYKSNPLNKVPIKKKEKSVFPDFPTLEGYLQITKKTSGKKAKWKRRFFCLKHNFLLSAVTPDAQKLERVISLEGATIDRLDLDGAENSLSVRTHRKTYLLQAETSQERERWVKHLQTATKLQITDLYEISDQLGVSATQNTTVVGGVCKTTGRKVAIKIVDKRTCDHRLLANEVKILKKLEHPHVVQLYDIFETPDQLYLIMERLLGGELFEQLTKRGDGFHYSEGKVCVIVRQIAHGVRYMHKNGICHRDLKPENILCTNDSVDCVKVADFGISKCLKGHEEFMQTMCGTISYTAPEVIKGQSYGKEVDYWSIGVIMYILLCGYPPFYGESDYQIAQSIVKSDVDMPADEWAHVSEEGKDVVRRLLSRDPRKRMTLDDLIEHTWTKGPSLQSADLKHVNSRLKNTVNTRKKARETKNTTGWLEANGQIQISELAKTCDELANVKGRRRHVSYGGPALEDQEETAEAEDQDEHNMFSASVP